MLSSTLNVHSELLCPLSLQRVYAITFPDAKQLKEYQHRIAEAKKRDHRLLGQQYTLFFFHPLSPGSCFFQPLGARIYNSLVSSMTSLATFSCILTDHGDGISCA
jgi:threonyl-tRNA synthetase